MSRNTIIVQIYHVSTSWPLHMYCHDFRVIIDGFGSVIGFIEHLRIVTTSNYSLIANSHTLQFTTARTKSSQSTVSLPVVA
jgi:hypothetical protein